MVDKPTIDISESLIQLQVNKINELQNINLQLRAMVVELSKLIPKEEEEEEEDVQD